MCTRRGTECSPAAVGGHGRGARCSSAASAVHVCIQQRPRPGAAVTPRPGSTPTRSPLTSICHSTERGQWVCCAYARASTRACSPLLDLDVRACLREGVAVLAHDHAESRSDDARIQLIDVRRASTCAVVERCVSGTRNPPPQARSTRPEASRQISRRAGRQPARAASPPR